MLCFRTLCVLGGGICRPRVNGLARVDERGVCFVVVPIKYSVGVRHALIAPQSYDVRVHVYTYSKLPLKLCYVTSMGATKLDTSKYLNVNQCTASFWLQHKQ